MFNLLKNRSQRFKTKEDFFFEFFNNPQHQWIVEDKYIKANFEEFFSLIPLKMLRDLWKDSDIWFISSSGKYSCAIEPIGCSVIMIFPELKKIMRSFNPDGTKAILAHELGHIYYNHSNRRIDVLEAQVEADKFAINLGFIEELESFLHDQSESLEKRVRLSYLTSQYFDSYHD